MKKENFIMEMENLRIVNSMLVMVVLEMIHYLLDYI